MRLYEAHGLLTPRRDAAGWRCYGATDIARIEQIVALRRLGFGIAHIEALLKPSPREGMVLEHALAAHQHMLEDKVRALVAQVAQTRRLREVIAQGRSTGIESFAELAPPHRPVIAAFDLPWPWNGERFELREMRALNYIVGPLGSGKTRFAQCLAMTLPDARWLGLDRVDEGATPQEALHVLQDAIAHAGGGPLVVDLIEHGLDASTQRSLASMLRERGAGARPLFVLTRSDAILDLARIGPDESILLCPANHAPPIRVEPCPGAPGYEAVATCLATPAARARLARPVPMPIPLLSSA